MNDCYAIFRVESWQLWWITQERTWTVDIRWYAWTTFTAQNSKHFSSAIWNLLDGAIELIEFLSDKISNLYRFKRPEIESQIIISDDGDASDFKAKCFRHLMLIVGNAQGLIYDHIPQWIWAFYRQVFMLMTRWKVLRLGFEQVVISFRLRPTIEDSLNDDQKPTWQS